MADRRGVALVLTLGLLALMGVLCLSFVYSAINSSKASELSVELTKTRQFAEMGMQRVITMLKLELYDTNDHDTFYPATKSFIKGTGDWDGYYYMTSLVDPSVETQSTDSLISALSLSMDGMQYIPNSVPTGESNDGVPCDLSNSYSWINIKEFGTIDGTYMERISGRYSYMVVDESGTIDPNSSVDTLYAEGDEVNNKYYNGYSLSELDLTDLGFSQSFTDDLRPASVGGLQPTNAKWFDLYQIVRTMDLQHASGGQIVLNNMNRLFFPYRRPDVIPSLTEITDSGTEATYNLSNIADAANNGNNGAYIRDSIVLPNGISPGIQWFANWPDDEHCNTDSDRFLDYRYVGYNLAANLKDYADTNHDASRDQCGSWNGSQYTFNASNRPYFWGNERVPYFNRFEVRVKNASVLSANGLSVTPGIDVYLKPQLVNMFTGMSSYATKCRIEVHGVATFTLRNGDILSKDLVWIFNPFDPTANADINGSFNAQGYITLGGDGLRVEHHNAAAIVLPGGVADQEAYRTVYDVNVQINYALMQQYNGTELWDFSMPANGYKPTAVVASLPWGVNDERFWMYETHCPMNNLFVPDWAMSAASPSTATQLASAAKPELWNDPDRRIYIRNGAIKHPVELGALWRMSPWSATDDTKAYRTLNLIDYQYHTQPEFTYPQMYSDAEDGVVDNYDSTLELEEGNGGDRNILDMVRVGTINAAEGELLGRININTRSPEVLRALFDRVIRTYYTYDEPITVAQRDALVDNILLKTLPTQDVPKVKGPLPLGILDNTRNPPLYGLLFQKADLPTLNEDQLEHLLALSMQLVAAKHNYFTCVVTAQAIKDIGEHDAAKEDAVINDIPGRIGRYDVGLDRVLAEQKIAIVLYRDATNNKVSIERFDYLDD